MKTARLIPVLLTLLAGLDGGFAGAGSAAGVVGRISRIKGQVEIRHGTEPARALRTDGDTSCLLREGEEVRLGESAELELLIGADHILLLRGPLDWYPIRWSCPSWDEQIRRAVLRDFLPAGRNKGDGEPDPRRPDAVLARIVPLASYDLPVMLGGAAGRPEVEELRAALPVFAHWSADGPDAAIRLRPVPARGPDTPPGVRIERSDGAVIAERFDPNLRAALDFVLSTEALWCGLKDLSASHPDGCPVRLRLLQGTSKSRATPTTAKLREHEAVEAEIENTGAAPLYAALLYANSGGDFQLWEEDVLIAAGEHASHKFSVSMTDPATREMLFVLATPTKLGETPKKLVHWGCAAVEFRVGR